MFSFVSLESLHSFSCSNGPLGFIAIQGKIYHQIHPTYNNSAIYWLLYDGHMENLPYEQWLLQLNPVWIQQLFSCLQQINPFVHAMKNFTSTII
jgi:hypothetical protein